MKPSVIATKAGSAQRSTKDVANDILATRIPASRDPHLASLEPASLSDPQPASRIPQPATRLHLIQRRRQKLPKLLHRTNLYFFIR